MGCEGEMSKSPRNQNSPICIFGDSPKQGLQEVRVDVLRKTVLQLVVGFPVPLGTLGLHLIT